MPSPRAQRGRVAPGWWLVAVLLLLVAGTVVWMSGTWRGLASVAGGSPAAAQARSVAMVPRRLDIGVPADLARVRDCDDPSCPWLRVLPSGHFRMGSDVAAGGDADEAPSHEVTLARRLAVMDTEVTVALFRSFADETGFEPSGGCVIWNGKQFIEDPKGSWRAPFVGLAQDERHPAVCVSWRDAQAFARWMSERTGQTYRLLTEAEWEYAARAGSAARFPFGDAESAVCSHANVADHTARLKLQYIAGADCDDGHAFVAPVAAFQANAWGLYDMIGNAWEWVQDCKAGYAAEARDAAAVELADCPHRLLRGGGWGNRPGGARSANRDGGLPTHRDNSTGFRLARVLVETPAAPASR